ncbi:hypothetical protein KGP17_17555 [Serratia sp. JSRIV001]|uniref:hypothetical protein n=1 Tax=Serratia sp. JSRIV001 TaxID=2831893 RepID=UPI001CBBB74F|nr:hypothetical protein [Serratia sp. JSRIV001]UAN44259.1 hypothetical protein KGP17_17555 [Serratia sp. JSRIV001]
MLFIASFRNGERKNVDLNLYELADFMIRDDVVALEKAYPNVEEVTIDEIEEIFNRKEYSTDALLNEILDDSGNIAKVFLEESKPKPLHIDLTKEDGRTKLQKVLDSYKK